MEWVLFQVQFPGRDLRPAGILLLDPRTDQLYLSFSSLAAHEIDEDLFEVWGELEEDLRAKAKEMGGRQVLAWLEADASNVFQVSGRHQTETADPAALLQQLLTRYVLAEGKGTEKPGQFQRAGIGQDQLKVAQEQVGPLPSSVLHVLSLLQNPNSHLSQIEQAVSRDPVLVAHLIRVANFALYNDPARTLFSAIQRLGVDAVQFQIMAVTAKKAFSAPLLRTVWNHSVEAAQRARDLAQGTAISPGEAGLVSLVHDIGQVVLWGLGDSFRGQWTQLREQGLTCVEAERTLCGKSHAEIGADLLTSWSFPSDMVRAVAGHHSSTRADSALPALLYLVEASIENDEDAYDMEKYAAALLSLKPKMRLNSRENTLKPDLAVLFFTAGAA